MLSLRDAEEALKLAVVVEKADGARRTGQSLGFALINYGRLFVRDYWTLFAIARELDCEIGEIAPRTDHAEKRQKWNELVRNSEVILVDVRALPLPLRSVAEARASGESWKKIAARYPGRLSWSMREDYELVLALLLRESHDAISFLASAENIFVVRERRVSVC